MAANTKNSLEYQILYYLNRPEKVEKFDITVEDIIRDIPLPESHLRKKIAELQTEGLIGDKVDPKGNGLTLTKNGQYRINQMATDVKLESVPERVKKSIDLLAIATFILAIIELIILCKQTKYSNTQNELIQLQDSIMREQLILQQQQFELDYPKLKNIDTTSLKIQIK